MTKVQNSLKKIAEGKTKIIYVDPENQEYVLVKSKDSITAGDGAKKDILENKGVFATATTSNIFNFLQFCGFPTHFKEQVNEDTFRAVKCDMIPVEVVARRLATGSYLKRNPSVPEGYCFTPPIIEFFFKDDKRHDPIMTPMEIMKEKITSKEGATITQEHLKKMASLCNLAFLLLERAWNTRGVTLVDLKVEFGFDTDGECILADVIDNDSWRIWPKGNKSLMKDKQVYRNLKESSQEALKEISKNYGWVAGETANFVERQDALCVILMGSPSDQGHTLEIQRLLEQYGVPVQRGILSAHKTTEALFERIYKLEASGKRLVYIAVAGRSNGLGPVLDGATSFPVINCPPYSDKFNGMDILSSLRLPSGLAATTVLEPETAALAAIKSLALDDPVLWGRLKVTSWKRTERILEEDQKLNVNDKEEKIIINPGGDI